MTLYTREICKTPSKDNPEILKLTALLHTKKCCCGFWSTASSIFPLLTSECYINNYELTLRSGRREELPAWPVLLLLLRCQPSFLLCASVAHVSYAQSCHFCSVHRLESAVLFQTLKQQMLLSPLTARSTILLETVTLCKSDV